MAVALALVGLTACQPPLGSPGKIDDIKLLESVVYPDGWRYDLYENTAYPCSLGEGNQTFVVAYPDGVGRSENRPLWVYMHGGGVGYFEPDGLPVPDGRRMTVELLDDANGQQGLQDQASTGSLIEAVRADGFRVMAVSMCNRDIYGGDDTPDPNNDGRTANGLFATKAAVQYATAQYTTDDFFVHGASAGSFGSYHVSWGLEKQGLAPAGTVADSGVINPLWLRAEELPPRCVRPEEDLAGVEARLHPAIVDPRNTPDQLIDDGRLTVPILEVWSQGDLNTCGLTPMKCPLPDGSMPTMGSTDCLHEPVRAAIAAQGPESRSLSMRLCVEGKQAPPCDRHVPTTGQQLNDPVLGSPWRANFTLDILDWVDDRRADD